MSCTVLLMLSSTVQYYCCQLAYIADAEEKFQLPKSLYCSNEQYCSIAKLQLQIYEETFFFNCHKAYIADTEHYCSITKRRILHKHCKLLSKKFVLIDIKLILQILSTIAVLPNGEYYISCVVLQLQMAYILQMLSSIAVAKQRKPHFIPLSTDVRSRC
jgi:hypothetical protein